MISADLISASLGLLTLLLLFLHTWGPKLLRGRTWLGCLVFVVAVFSTAFSCSASR